MLLGSAREAIIAFANIKHQNPVKAPKDK